MVAEEVEAEGVEAEEVEEEVSIHIPVDRYDANVSSSIGD